MNRYLLLALAVAAIGATALLWPTQRTGTLTNLPWQIETLPEGVSRVFGITLGRTTAAEAQHILGQAAEFALFEGQSGDLSLEAFFSNVELGHIVARVIARLAADPSDIQRLREQATNRQPMPSGAARLGLSETANREVQDWPVVGITYSPVYARLDAQVLEARFGKPAEILDGADAQRYWLYPALGLAIITNTEGRTLLEYVAPRDFAQLRARLDTRASTGAGP
jgi:hypothetical protein